MLIACAALVPLAALAIARSSGSPETRHLIFLLPFVALPVAAGVARLGRVWGPAALAALVVAQIAWALGQDARALRVGAERPRGGQGRRGGVSRRRRRSPNDVLFGYDPLFIQAWERNGDFPVVTLPRADADLALHNLLSLERPLGHGVWVFDASKTTNYVRSLQIPLTSPRPASAFEVRDYGPFLVIRTREPVVTPGPIPPPRGPGDAGRETTVPRRRRHQPADDRARRTGATRLRRLSLPVDELPVAGRLLEGSEPCGCLALALLRPQPARRRDRRGGADGRTDQEGTCS